VADFITTIDEYGELVVSCDGPDPQGDFVLPSWDLAGEPVAYEPSVFESEPPVFEEDALAAPDGIELWSGAAEEVWAPDERLAYEDPPDATWPAGESDLWS